ncbi:MAG: methylenetetrahydrofolate--tRNA-(uracil(54)-C(5))-methyltransferase (FADH(2)-oxidizing) TrmFO, partial [Proteobacteria bacterium]|nr:methylenetetrahydrofolate--tRNA-(uracil(54)-C(5))-methyltransferase (FADH(2)-oxidizing) TrmFO [Pseudomonadota bacterium]
PATTAHGALITHLTDPTARNFQPSNINFGLMPPAPRGVRKKERPAFHARRALEDISAWQEAIKNED